MTNKEIQDFINKYDRKKWYYYYDFGACQVRNDLQNIPDSSLNNWKRILPIIKKTMNSFNNNPLFLDIGCNMGLYAHEISKLGGFTTGIDINIEQSRFFQKFIRENKKDTFNAEFLEYDVTKQPLINLHRKYNIVTFFCVIYHLFPHQNFVLENLPDHTFIIMQGNTPRLTSKKRTRKGQYLAGINGMENLLKDHGYDTEVYLRKYTKPVIVGQR